MFRGSANHVVKFIKCYTVCLSLLGRQKKTWFSFAVVVDFSLCYSCASSQPAFVSCKNKVRTLSLPSRNFETQELSLLQCEFFRDGIDSSRQVQAQRLVFRP